MTHKQIFWRVGCSVVLSSALVCGVVLYQSPQQDTLRLTAGLSSETELTPALTLVADDKGAEQPPATINKRKKTVTGKKEGEVEYNKLTPEEARVILRKGTERAFTGEYTDTKDPGTYICRRCNAALYHSATKFESHCGWPSFDDEIKGAVKHRRETDGTGRVEIVCANCGGHLGHVFFGEGYTTKNTRHCVNSVSMRFIAEGKPLPEVIKPKDVKRDKAGQSTEPATGPAPAKEPTEKSS